MSDDQTLTPLHKHMMFELVWRAMSELNLERIVVEFDGSGDSGDIQDICPVRPGETDYRSNLTTNMLAKFDAYQVELPMEPELTSGPVTLRDLVHSLSNDILSYDEAPDWVNNDGGYGELTWWAASNDEQARIEVEYNIRYTETNLEERAYNKFGEVDEDC